jgi:Histidine kinase-, DNA gyrase B-, and HSP90-like ATPase
MTSRVPIDTSAVAAVQLHATADELRRAVANLVGNAVCHARARVAVSLAAGPTGAVLVVADDGPGIPVGQRDRVFGRFVRLDAARSRDTGGAGLGLAIAKKIVEAHGGTIVIGDARPVRASKYGSRSRALRATAKAASEPYCDWASANGDHPGWAPMTAPACAAGRDETSLRMTSICRSSSSISCRNSVISTIA